MDRQPMIPPNFVTLRQLKELKEKREEEERLKREEDQRLRRLKEEEEERERLRKLKEEEEEEASLRNLPPKTLGSRRPPRYRRNYGRGGPRRIPNPEERLRGEGRSDFDGTAADARLGGRRKGRTRANREAEVDGTILEKQVAVKGGTDSDASIADARLGGERSGRLRANPEAADVDATNLEEQVALKAGSDGRFSSQDEHRRWKIRERKKKCNAKKKALSAAKDGMTEMPLSNNGSEAVLEGVGAPAERKTERREEVKKVVLVRVIGSESVVISNIEKRVSDLKIGGRNPNPRRGGGRGRGRDYGGWGRGGGGGGGGDSVWVRKTTDS